jgi:hypothetical protein
LLRSKGSKGKLFFSCSAALSFFAFLQNVFTSADLKLLSSFCQLITALHACCIHHLLGMHMKVCSFLEHGIR